MIALFILAAVTSTPSTEIGATDLAFARKVMRDFAQCTVHSEHQLVRKFVLMKPSDRLPDEEFQRVADWRCLGLLGGRLKMRPFQFRAALAEELIRRESVRLSNVDAKSRPPLDWSVPDMRTINPKTGKPLNAAQLAQEQSWHDYQMAESLVGELGECVVRADPTGAMAVLKTKDEAADLPAMKALSPQIAGCVRAGLTLKFNRSNLRDAIALSYYRLAMAGSTLVAGNTH